MELLLRSGLGLILSFVVSAPAFAQTTGTLVDSNPLDEEGGIGLQQNINQILAQYDGQLAGLRSQDDQLRASGYQQCMLQAKEGLNQADQAKKQAQMQALQGMLQPGAETIGQGVQRLMDGSKNEKATLTAQLKSVVARCRAYMAEGGTGREGVLTCDEATGTASVNKNLCKSAAAGGHAASTSPYDTNCVRLAQAEAQTNERDMQAILRQIKETDSASGGLMQSTMALAAAGIGGMLMNNQGKDMAKYMSESAEGAGLMCKAQVDSQLKALATQISLAEAAKARDLLMANMSAEYATKVRRKAQAEEDNESVTGGGPIAIDGGPLATDIPPIESIPFGKGSGGGGGGGGSPAGGGGPVAAPSWDFGGGAGFDGGSRLPDQPEATGLSGSAMAATNSKGGGFGAIEGGAGAGAGGAQGNRGPAGEAEVLGDGGLRVLLARTSLVHTKHASVLMKSIDFDRLAKSQGISPKPASISPAGPN